MGRLDSGRMLSRSSLADAPTKTKIALILGALGAANVLLWLLAWSLSGRYAFLLATGRLAYGFGPRHAVDADHICAIDNTTRKLMQEGKRGFTADLVRVQQALPGGLGLGVVWWEPEGVGSGKGYAHDVKAGFFNWEPYTLFSYGTGPDDPRYSSLLPAIGALGVPRP